MNFTIDGILEWIKHIKKKKEQVIGDLRAKKRNEDYFMSDFK